MMTMSNKLRKIEFITVPYGLAEELVHKPFYSNAPMAFLWLSAYLGAKGIDCLILDAYTEMLGVEKILSDIENNQPDIVGLSVFTIAVYDNLFLAKKIREKFPKIIIIFGGYHVNHHWDEILESGLVDFCVLSEGEMTTWELIQCLNNAGDLRKVKGLAWKESNEIVTTERRPYSQKFDEMPLLPYEKINKNQYRPWWFSHTKKDKFMTTVTSKGCPMQCIFCDIAKTEGTKFRCMSAARVIREVEYLYYEMGVNQLEFLDALFTTNKKRVKDICRMLIEKNIAIDWACSSTILHADDLEMLEMMSRSGCRMIFFGVESGNTDMIRKFKKVSLDLVTKVVGMTKSAGIRSHASFILGLPGETKETMSETVKYAKELGADSVSFSIAIPYKGTELYDIYKEKIFVSDYRKFEGRAVFEVPEYSPQYLENMVINAHRRFYFRPKYVISRLRSIRSMSELGAHFEVGVNLLQRKLRYKNG